MDVIDHGNLIIEYQGIIENPEQLIANINQLDIDGSVFEVLPPFQDWLEGYTHPDGVWRASHNKGKNKVIRWSETEGRRHLSSIRDYVASKVLDPIWIPLRDAVRHYAAAVNVPVPKYITRNIDIRVYATGQELGLHTDTNHNGPSTTHSLVIYLNDDHEGGEIHFPDYNLVIKPKAGSIVAFPSTVLHESLPVTKGNKWHSPCFWYEEISLVTSGKESPGLERFV